jgi:hypothetical protein
MESPSARTSMCSAGRPIGRRLDDLTRSTRTEHRTRLKARIMLMAAARAATRGSGGRSAPHNRRGVEVACALCQRPLGRLFRSGPSGARWKYDAEPARRILALRDTPPPEGYANWTGSVLARALGEINVQYFRRSLARTENIRDRMQHETWRLRRSN